MGLFRSEEMMLVQLIMPAEAAHQTVTALGEVGMLQFKDLNAEKSPFQRTYANQVKRCDEMLRRLRFFGEELNKVGLLGLTPRSGVHNPYALDELETKLQDLENELLEVNANQEKLVRSESELVELQLVLEKAGAFFDDGTVSALRGEAAGSSTSRPPLTDDSDGDMGIALLEFGREQQEQQLGFVTGVVLTKKLLAFERVLFRATRGNIFLKTTNIEGKVQDPLNGGKVEKTVFVVFFAGDRARNKILKICEAFQANRYPFPEDRSRQQQMNAEVTARLSELHTTIEAGDRQRDTVLAHISSNLLSWTSQVKTEKAVYFTLNQLSVEVTSKCLIAEGWCPTGARRRIAEAIERASYQSHAQVPTIFKELATKEQPPTYFQTNKITESFQEIVDAYGVARYREMNPAVYTMVTFPFLFAVMFGDVGHAAIMLMAAVYLILNEKRLASVHNEIFQMGFQGRYLILLMAVFSLYTGLIYNECFSMPMTVFGSSHYVCESDPSLPLHKCPEGSSEGLILDPHSPSPYPFGLDPVWHGTKTELQFTNSMKMKMSVIMGVTHMMFGLVLSCFNHLHFHDKLGVYTEFVPQVLFLFSMFGYLSILILHKWVSGTVSNPNKADLYHVIIYMFLSPGNVDCDDGLGHKECPENLMFPGQAGFQVFLVFIIVVCIPWMLSKPFILRHRHNLKHQHRDGFVALANEEEEGRDPHGPGDDFNFGDLMVHQLIHTIEFCLGAVSNTASYLRLWALSLAHAQLSAVFWDRILMLGIQMQSVPAMIVCFFVWALATVSVLLLMESLSAFLHALRLHWVEFQGKFYHGDGYKFVPFSFSDIRADSVDLLS